VVIREQILGLTMQPPWYVHFRDNIRSPSWSVGALAHAYVHSVKQETATYMIELPQVCLIVGSVLALL
jgi:hypothetical protein